MARKKWPETDEVETRERPIKGGGFTSWGKATLTELRKLPLLGRAKDSGMPP